jgi:uncharacterized membrane protein YhaH (DUF805 family)
MGRVVCGDRGDGWMGVHASKRRSVGRGRPLCLICVFTLIPIAVKRLHDLDIAGWWVAVFVALYTFAMVPRDPTVTSLGSAALFIAVIWLGSKKGDQGGNRHGPVPI